MTPTVRQRSTLVASWALAAVAVGVLLAVAEAADGPLDDPDPARQRPGLLDAFGPPTPAPPVDDQLPAREELTVVFFERPGRGGALCDALESSDLATEAALVLVVQGTGREPRCAGATVVDDPNGDLAVRYGLRRPADRGAPVGYVIVDSSGLVRYRTLDPAVANELGEVRTMVEAAR